MKTLVESIQQINEGLCKDLYKIRKGQQVYVIGETGTKAKLVTVKEVSKSAWNSRHSDANLNISVQLEDNDIVDWFTLLTNKGGSDELYATYSMIGKPGYVGVSKEAIHALRSSNNKPRIDQYSKAIEDAQSKLEELMNKKQALEETISSEISESLKYNN